MCRFDETKQRGMTVVAHENVYDDGVVAERCPDNQRDTTDTIRMFRYTLMVLGEERGMVSNVRYNSPIFGKGWLNTAGRWASIDKDTGGSSSSSAPRPVLTCRLQILRLSWNWFVVCMCSPRCETWGIDSVFRLKAAKNRSRSILLSLFGFLQNRCKLLLLSLFDFFENCSRPMLLSLFGF